MSDNQTHFNHVASGVDITASIDEALKSSAAQKEAERDELSRQIDAFLTSGGQINIIEPNVLADPPQKPTSNYGSQPI